MNNNKIESILLSWRSGNGQQIPVVSMIIEGQPAFTKSWAFKEDVIVLSVDFSDALKHIYPELVQHHEVKANLDEADVFKKTLICDEIILDVCKNIIDAECKKHEKE